MQACAAMAMRRIALHAYARAAVERGHPSIKIHEVKLENIRAVRCDRAGCKTVPGYQLPLDRGRSSGECGGIARGISRCLRNRSAAGGLSRNGQAACRRHCDGRRRKYLRTVPFQTVVRSQFRLGRAAECDKSRRCHRHAGNPRIGELLGVEVMPHCGYFGPGYLAVLHITGAMAGNVLFERLYLDLKDSPFSP